MIVIWPLTSPARGYAPFISRTRARIAPPNLLRSPNSCPQAKHGLGRASHSCRLSHEHLVFWLKSRLVILEWLLHLLSRPAEGARSLRSPHHVLRTRRIRSAEASRHGRSRLGQGGGLPGDDGGMAAGTRTRRARCRSVGEGEWGRRF